jgi:hypothetical protein
MPEGVDEAAGAFANEIAPQTRPRDQAGKFVRETKTPEPMFGARPIEGDPLTGDTSDGGDNPRLRARERDIADGREQRDRRAAAEEEGDGGQRSRAPSPGNGHADADDGYELLDDEPEDLTAEQDSDAADGQDGSSDERYEVTVDGEPKEVSLQEALNGYIRQETFHKRNAQLLTVQQELEQEHGRLMANWQIWHKARKDYEEDLANMIPAEPNWDQEFARDPRAAHENQKVYQVLYNKLGLSQRARAEREAAEAQEVDRRTQKYAVEGFARFVAMHPKIFPDEPTLKKNIQSMRRTAMAAGFSELEVATVYDPRMLTILLKASKYDRMQASNLKAVIPGKGRALPPGAATPLGNARRSGFDDAQRRLASSGKLQDAVEVFRRML